MLRLARLLLLISYWGGTLKELWQILADRERHGHVLLVLATGTLLSFGAAVVLSGVDARFDYNEDGALDDHDGRFLTVLWWSLLQVEDPGNLVRSPEAPLVVSISLGLTFAGVLLFSFLVGIGTSAVEELVRRSRIRPPGMRGHTAILCLGSEADRLAEELGALYTKNGRVYRAAVLARGEPLVTLERRTGWALARRRGDPLQRRDLARVDIARAKRTVLLADAGDGDGLLVAGLLAVRAVQPTIPLFAVVEHERDFAAARHAGGPFTTVIGASSFMGYVLARAVIDPVAITLLEELLTAAGCEVYTYVLGDDQRFTATGAVSLAAWREAATPAGATLLGLFLTPLEAEPGATPIFSLGCAAIPCEVSMRVPGSGCTATSRCAHPRHRIDSGRPAAPEAGRCGKLCARLCDPPWSSFHESIMRTLDPPEALDLLATVLAVRRGLIDPDARLASMREAAERRARGERASAAQVLVRLGALTTDDGRALVALVKVLEERARRIEAGSGLADPFERAAHVALGTGELDRRTLRMALVEEAESPGSALERLVQREVGAQPLPTIDTSDSSADEGGADDAAFDPDAGTVVGAAPAVTRWLGPDAARAEVTVKVLPPARAAERLGRYPVAGSLGSGGMGDVLSVLDLDLGREVAAKVIRGKAERAAELKFVREARITGQLEHPSIVPAHELGRTADGRLFFTMKKVGGEDLSALIARVAVERRELARAAASAPGGRGRSSGRHGARRSGRHRAAGAEHGASDSGVHPSTAGAEGAGAPGGLPHGLMGLLQAFLKVCDGVSFAHSRGVIHRDLKPANIRVGEYGEVLVMDWGLAKFLGGGDLATVDDDVAASALAPDLAGRGGADALRTLDGTIMGTPAYMPPEQARGEILTLDARADVYALGAILYDLLALEPPYEGRGAWDVLARVEAGPPPPPGERVGGAWLVPWELEKAVERAMARRAKDRYASVEALRSDVEAFLAGRTLVAVDYTAVQRLGKVLRRHRGFVIAAASVLVTVIGALVYGVVSANQRVAAIALERTKAEEAAVRAESERTKAETSYAEARRMGAVHRVRALEQAGREDLWWTRPDLATGKLKDEPSAARLAEVDGEIAKWCREVDGLLAERAAYLRALATGQAEALAAPDDAWKSFRAVILGELCAGLVQLDELRDRAVERRRSYEALKNEDETRASAWARARVAIARHARYGGLELPPQVGLVPLGENPVTGLWEFGVAGTGDLPVRAAGEALPIGDRTAIVLVLIPGGDYLVGAQPGRGRHVDSQAQAYEGPEQSVRLRPYFIARTELTQHQWTCLLPGSTNPSRHAAGAQAGPIVVTERHPVESVSWDDCAERLARWGLVLPSEAQWEAAARGGRTTSWWPSAEASGLARTDNVADACARRVVTGIGATEAWDDGHFIHAPVASYPAGHNPFGLFDVHGNVREWCRDPFDTQPLVPIADPHGDRPPSTPGVRLRVYRGGCWFDAARIARSAFRFGIAPAIRVDTLGVRPSRSTTGFFTP